MRKRTCNCGASPLAYPALRALGVPESALHEPFLVAMEDYCVEFIDVGYVFTACYFLWHHNEKDRVLEDLKLEDLKTAEKFLRNGCLWDESQAERMIGRGLLIGMDAAIYELIKIIDDLENL
jgi:hypothetical protein